MNIQMNQTFRWSENVITREIAGETLLIPLCQTGADVQKIFVLNETAASIWRLLAEPHNVAQLVDGLRPKYHALNDVIRKDVEVLLRDLLDRNFLTVATNRE